MLFKSQLCLELIRCECFSKVYFYFSWSLSCPKREYDENEVDPYHGNEEKLPEPEALDLPDDLNLDSEDKEGDGDSDREDGEGVS